MHLSRSSVGPPFVYELRVEYEFQVRSPSESRKISGKMITNISMSFIVKPSEYKGVLL